MLPAEPPGGLVPSTWKGEGNVSTNPGADGNSVHVQWSLGREDGRRGELQVWFDPAEHHRVSAVRLSLPDGLTPTDLQRFPWARWLAVADASRGLWNSGLRLDDPAFFGKAEPKALNSAVSAAREGRRPPRGLSATRPGRRGHPDKHYQDVALRYMSLRKEGITNPTAMLATEYVVSRSTAAGWVSEARRRGHLAPARRGRPG